MTVYLDDEAVQLDGRSLADVLASATDRLRGGGRMVVEVQLNGQTLTGETLTQQADAPLPADGELRLYSAEPAALAGSALEQVRAQLLDQQPKLEEAADLLQQDRAADAFQLINQVNEVWLTAMQAVEQAAKLIGADLANLDVADKPFPRVTADLLSQLQALKQQITDQDTAALADALGYEWPAIIEQWDAVLGTLIEKSKHP